MKTIKEIMDKLEDTQRKKDIDEAQDVSISGDTKYTQGKEINIEQMPGNMDNHAEKEPDKNSKVVESGSPKLKQVRKNWENNQIVKDLGLKTIKKGYLYSMYILIGFLLIFSILSFWGNLSLNKIANKDFSVTVNNEAPIVNVTNADTINPEFNNEVKNEYDFKPENNFTIINNIYCNSS